MCLFLFSLVLSRSQGLECGDTADSDDEGGGAGIDIADAIEEGDEEGGESAAMDEEEPSSAPVPDPDGWETVSRGKSKAGKKKK
jgi:hypothetical protein